jgi:hypothetical protein
MKKNIEKLIAEEIKNGDEIRAQKGYILPLFLDVLNTKYSYSYENWRR